MLDQKIIFTNFDRNMEKKNNVACDNYLNVFIKCGMIGNLDLGPDFVNQVHQV